MFAAEHGRALKCEPSTELHMTNFENFVAFRFISSRTWVLYIDRKNSYVSKLVNYFRLNQNKHLLDDKHKHLLHSHSFRRHREVVIRPMFRPRVGYWEAAVLPITPLQLHVICETLYILFQSRNCKILVLKYQSYRKNS